MATLVFDKQVSLELILEALASEGAAGSLDASGIMGFRTDVIGAGNLGNLLTIPYLQFPGTFQRTTTTVATTANVIGNASQTATIGAYGYQFTQTDWDRFAMAAVGDPLQAAAAAVAKKFKNKIWDDALTTGGAIFDNAIALDYSGTGDLGYDALVEAHEEFGDEDNGEMALIVHSAKLKSLRNSLDTTGRPLFQELASGERRLTDGTKVFTYDAMQTDAGPTRYYSYLCKIGSAVTVYDETNFTIEELRTFANIPFVTQYSIQTFGATHMYSPFPECSKKGIVRIKTT